MKTEIVFMSLDGKKIIVLCDAGFCHGYNCYSGGNGVHYTKLNNKSSWFTNFEDALNFFDKENTK